MGVRSCRYCGCTDARACMTDDGPCYWIADSDICSACALRLADDPWAAFKPFSPPWRTMVLVFLIGFLIGVVGQVFAIALFAPNP